MRSLQNTYKALAKERATKRVKARAKAGIKTRTPAHRLAALGALLVALLVAPLVALGTQSAPAKAATSGDLLSALVALQRADFTRSEAYLSRVYASDDTIHSQAGLRSYYFLLSLALGKRDQAVELAQRLVREGTDTSQVLPHLVLTAEAIRRNDKQAALAALDKVPESATRQPEVLLLRAVLLSHGDSADKTLALRALQTMGEPDEQKETAFYFTTFVLDALGEEAEVAERIEAAISEQSMGVAEVFLNFGALLEKQGQDQAALDFYQRGLAEYPEDFFLATRLWTLTNGNSKPYLINTQSLRLRAAQAVSDLARIQIASGGTALQALSDASLALFLEPKLEEALLLRAEVWSALGDEQAALNDLSRLSRTSPTGWFGTLEWAQILIRQDRFDEAQRVVLALRNPWQRYELPQLQGGLARAQDNWQAAAEHYDQAIAFYPEAGDGLWWLYYSRGIAHERADQWDKAEADFLQALSLRENQADVLNYLAYSWADQNRNLDRALEMLREAAGQRPDQGHIIDSLGWVYYRLGDYERATEYLEEAASYLPVDAVVNDHLGDAYWRTGRKREARIQWRRARAEGADHPDGGQEMLDTLNEKIKNGLN